MDNVTLPLPATVSYSTLWFMTRQDLNQPVRKKECVHYPQRCENHKLFRVFSTAVVFDMAAKLYLYCAIILSVPTGKGLLSKFNEK